MVKNGKLVNKVFEFYIMIINLRLLKYSLLLLLLLGCRKKKVTEDLNILFPPSELTAKVVSTTQVDLKWVDKSTNETGFKVERRIGTTQYAFLATVGANLSVYTDNTVQANTSYTYRVYSFNPIGNSLTYSNEVTVQTPGLTPVVNTIDISDTSASSATSGGEITSDGGSPILERGVVWSTTQNPTIENSQRSKDSIGVGKFKSSITGLNAETTYYVRAYAKNAFGVSYGNQLQFKTKAFYRVGNGVKDVEGTTYKTVLIGNQEWMAENLRSRKYQNGDTIEEINDILLWRSQSGSLNKKLIGIINGNIQNFQTYGYLYNYRAMIDNRKVCPVGYHVPSLVEWGELENYLGKDSAAYKLKSKSGWPEGVFNSIPYNDNGNNASGFNALPGGTRSYSGDSEYGTSFWTSSPPSLPSSPNPSMGEGIQIDVKKTTLIPYSFNEFDGLRIRCIKDK